MGFFFQMANKIDKNRQIDRKHVRQNIKNAESIDSLRGIGLIIIEYRNFTKVNLHSYFFNTER